MPWVYVLGSPSLPPDNLKIGLTRFDPDRRLKQHRTSVLDAEYVELWEHPQAEELERELQNHPALAYGRRSREHFCVPIDTIRAAFAELTTPEAVAARDER